MAKRTHIQFQVFNSKVISGFEVKTYCGIPDREGIQYTHLTKKKVDCKNCIKKDRIGKMKHKSSKKKRAKVKRVKDDARIFTEVLLGLFAYKLLQSIESKQRNKRK